MASCEIPPAPAVYLVVKKIPLGPVGDVPLKEIGLREGGSVNWWVGGKFNKCNVVAVLRGDCVVVGHSDDGYSFKEEAEIPLVDLNKNLRTKGRFRIDKKHLYARRESNPRPSD